MNNPAMRLLMDAMLWQNRKTRVCGIVAAALAAAIIVVFIKSKGAIK